MATMMHLQMDAVILLVHKMHNYTNNMMAHKTDIMMAHTMA